MSTTNRVEVEDEVHPPVYEGGGAGEFEDEKKGSVDKLEKFDSKDPRAGGFTQVNEVIAQGIAKNVDDFMASVGSRGKAESKVAETLRGADVGSQTLVSEANDANERERGMNLKTAFRVYPKAIMWSMLLSSALIMEGYDTAVIGSCTCSIGLCEND